MLDNVIIGRYIKGDSFIHQLDPRTKLIGCMVYFIYVFQSTTVLDYSVLIALLALVVLGSKIGIGYFLKGIRPMIWVILFTAFFQVLFISSGEVYWQFGFLSITHDGLLGAALITSRFILIIGMSTMLSLTTDPLMLADAMESLMKPLKKVGVPVREIGLIVSIAMRFVPTILDETQTIMKAQRSRGVSFNEGSLMQRIKAFVPVLVPLFASVIRRSTDLANAMEARGYSGDVERSKYRVLKYQWVDIVVAIILCAIGVVLYFV